MNFMERAPGIFVNNDQYTNDMGLLRRPLKAVQRPGGLAASPYFAAGSTLAPSRSPAIWALTVPMDRVSMTVLVRG